VCFAESVAMTRNIVLCLDGTSNQYSATNTNVVKLYAMLDRAHDQLAYYQPGIGTSVPTGIFGFSRGAYTARGRRNAPEGRAADAGQ
jgi:uncharacterized protein (DUF2235 family)